MQAINDQLWGTDNDGKDTLLVPPCVEAILGDDEAMLGVEGGAVCTSHQEEKEADHGTQITATPAMMSSRGLWEITEEIEM